MSSRFGVGDSAFRTLQNETRLVDTVPFPAYTREIMRRAGEFDEELVRNQDDEYNTRVRRAGRPGPPRGRRAFDLYHSRPTLRSLWRQYFQYGYWKVRVMQKHPTQMRWRHFAPALLVLGCWPGGLAAGWRCGLGGGGVSADSTSRPLAAAGRGGRRDSGAVYLKAAMAQAPVILLCFWILTSATVSDSSGA